MGAEETSLTLQSKPFWGSASEVMEHMREFQIDKVFLHSAARDSSLAHRTLAAFPMGESVPVGSEAEVRHHLTGPDKHAIYIGPRSSSFVSRFHPPNGMICASFWKFTSETECLYSCHYCYLALTMRILPYLRIASNIDRGLREAEQVLKHESTQGRRAMFNIGELADGRLLDPLTELSGQVLPLLNRYRNGMLHVLTKSGTDTIGNYLDLAHLAQGQVVHVASVNPQPIIDLTEDDTPPLTDRLAALRALQGVGYRVRVRIDPIFDLRDLVAGVTKGDVFQVYEDLIEVIQQFVTPEIFTLGSYRHHPQLIPRIRFRYPYSPVLRIRTHREGAKHRVSERETFYRHLIDRLHQTFPRVRLALCKETGKMWQKCGLQVRPLECSCLPFAHERQVN